MKNSMTLYHFIIDRSGSMASCMTSTIKAYEDQMANLASLQKELPDQQMFHSLTLFNNFVDQVIDFGPLEEKERRRAGRIKAEGTTALLDAIGLSVQRINQQYGAAIEEDRMSVVVTILTDGHENASETYSYPQIARMISGLEETGKWTFTILGAEVDSFSIAGRLNINEKNVLAFMKEDMEEVFDEYGSALKSYSRFKNDGLMHCDFVAEIKNRDRRRTTD
ncbi:MAG: hypothetical protein ACO4CH_03665 [Saprospiraceae bacterium]|jgi:hypothetical protein